MKNIKDCLNEAINEEFDNISELKAALKACKTLKDVIFTWATIDGKEPAELSLEDENISTVLGCFGAPAIADNEQPSDEEWIEWAIENQNHIITRATCKYNAREETGEIHFMMDGNAYTFYC